MIIQAQLSPRERLTQTGQVNRFSLIYFAFSYWDIVYQTAALKKNYIPQPLLPDITQEDICLGIWCRTFFSLSKKFRFHLPHKTAGAALDGTDILIPMILNQILTLLLTHHGGLKCLYVAHRCWTLFYKGTNLLNLWEVHCEVLHWSEFHL